MMIEGMAGLLVAVAMIVSARLKPISHWLFSVTLILLPVIYIAFGLFTGDSSIILGEILVGVPFIVVGFLCLRLGFVASGYLLASLWLIHGGYDLYHDFLFINPGVPSWYPVFCAVVDMVVGSYLFYSMYRLRTVTIKSTGASA